MKKITNKYYFSTEGETEKWYLQHLEKLINNEAASVCNVSFYVKKSNPISYVKGINVLKKTPVYHVFDVESNQEDDIKSFENMLGCMRKAERLGRAIVYENGYSNLTFELWLILHKMDCNCVNNKSNYLNLINKAFNVNSSGLTEYKEEKFFKDKVLSKITLDDVKNAVKRADEIMKQNKQNNFSQSFKKYSWYKDNPATELGNIIGKILKQCGLISS